MTAVWICGAAVGLAALYIIALVVFANYMERRANGLGDE